MSLTGDTIHVKREGVEGERKIVLVSKDDSGKVNRDPVFRWYGCFDKDFE